MSFCLQEAVHLTRVSLSVTTNKTLMMTLTGHTSTPKKCHTSHQTCHKVPSNLMYILDFSYFKLLYLYYFTNNLNAVYQQL